MNIYIYIYPDRYIYIYIYICIYHLQNLSFISIFSWCNGSLKTILGQQDILFLKCLLIHKRKVIKS